jgi:hypothetical protein
MNKLFLGFIRDNGEEKFTSICRNCVLGLFLAPWLALAGGPDETRAARGGSGLGDHPGLSLRAPVPDKEASPHRALSLDGIPSIADSERPGRFPHSSPGELTASLFPARMEALPHRPERAPQLGAPDLLAQMEGKTFQSALTLKSGTIQVRTRTSDPRPAEFTPLTGPESSRDQWTDSGIPSPIAHEQDSGAFFFTAGNFRETFLNGRAGASHPSAEAKPDDSPLTQIIDANTILPYRNFLGTDLFRFFPEERPFDFFEGMK